MRLIAKLPFHRPTESWLQHESSDAHLQIGTRVPLAASERRRFVKDFDTGRQRTSGRVVGESQFFGRIQTGSEIFLMAVAGQFVARIPQRALWPAGKMGSSALADMITGLFAN